MNIGAKIGENEFSMKICSQCAAVCQRCQAKVAELCLVTLYYYLKLQDCVTDKKAGEMVLGFAVARQTQEQRDS